MYLQMLAAPEILKGNHILCGAETGVLTFCVCRMCVSAVPYIVCIQIFKGYNFCCFHNQLINHET